VIVPLIRSPFVAKIAVTGFLSYRDAIFEKTSDDLCEKILRKSRFLVFDFLDKLIAHASLRALDAKFLLDHWCEVPMEEQIRQSFHLLSSACYLYSNISDEEDEEDEEKGKKVNGNHQV
jgi:hypothetical protein